MNETGNVIEARGLSKSYGEFLALDNASFTLPLGRILGVIGENGAGKTTMLNAILGLIRYDGEVNVLGMNPISHRKKLMEDVSFISDVATLPRWMRVDQILDFVERVHPHFSRDKAVDFLGRTTIPMNKAVKNLSKGMITQLHLAIVMAVDAKLLVLDEPTLGLDVIFRKSFYASLLEEYFDEQRTILVTTHQVEEIEHILTDAMFIKDGRIILHEDLDTLHSRFVEVVVDKDQADALRKMNPLTERTALGRTAFVFEDADRDKLSAFGETRHVGLADVFVAKVTGEQK